MVIRTYSQLLSHINDNIKSNNNKEITGSVTNIVLKYMLDSTSLIHSVADDAERNALDPKYIGMRVTVGGADTYICTDTAGSGTWQKITFNGLTETEIDTLLGDKQDTEAGRGLSTNDLTNALVSKINDAADLIHNQNTDTKLDEGGDDEITAFEIKQIIDIIAAAGSGNVFHIGAEASGSDDTPFIDTDELKIVGSETIVKTLISLAANAKLQRESGTENISFESDKIKLEGGQIIHNNTSDAKFTCITNNYKETTSGSETVNIDYELEETNSRTLKTTINVALNDYSKAASFYSIATFVRETGGTATLVDVGDDESPAEFGLDPIHSNFTPTSPTIDIVASGNNMRISLIGVAGLDLIWKVKTETV